MYRIAFHQEVFTPKTIEGNETAERPVTIDLTMAAGPDHARLKSILWATGGTAGLIPGQGWSPEMQESVAAAFKMGPQLFVNCVGKIRNLAAPAVLCRLAGIPVPDKAKDEDDIPITNGAQFAKVAPYLSELALELAFEIQRLTVKGPAAKAEPIAPSIHDLTDAELPAAEEHASRT